MRIYMHTCMLCRDLYVYVYVCMHVFVYISLYMYVSMCVHVHTYICMYLCILYMIIPMYVSIYVNICVCFYICEYIVIISFRFISIHIFFGLLCALLTCPNLICSTHQTGASVGLRRTWPNHCTRFSHLLFYRDYAI